MGPGTDSILPAFIIRRLPVRFTFDNNYFNDPYQGIPIGGYTQIVEKLLDDPHITTQVNTDFFSAKDDYLRNYDHIIFSGMIDQFFNYRFGELGYRSLRFETKLLEEPNYQGNAVINYTMQKHLIRGLLNTSGSSLEMEINSKLSSRMNIHNNGNVVLNLIIQSMTRPIITCSSNIVNMLMQTRQTSLLADDSGFIVITTWIRSLPPRYSSLRQVKNSEVKLQAHK